ncbi:MAG: DUF2791 family P-loop domain-containing protein [Verrucomicrobia bacterium]|nr:DUF2791 family P-loop domain-containing protein [Verrucomicrobiota bacterium]
MALEISVGLERFCGMWANEILPFIAAGGSELRFLEGANGRGKTHMLRVLSKLAEDRGFLTCYTSGDAETQAFESLEATYQAIAKSLCWRCDGESVIGLPRIIERLDRDQLGELRASSHVVAPVRNLCRAYHWLLNDESVSMQTKVDLKELLVGNKAHRVLFRDLFRRTPNLPRPITKLGKRNAGQWLRSLLSIPLQLGFKGVVVFFDETGADLLDRRKSRKKRQEHMANLRNLIDYLAVGSLPGCAIVYGVTHNLLELAAEDYPALAQRIERTDQSEMWNVREPNPRAVWTPLDELTHPTPPAKVFFESLGQKIGTLAQEAGVLSKSDADIHRIVRTAVGRMAGSAQDDSIRQFVKDVSSKLLN